MMISIGRHTRETTLSPLPTIPPTIWIKGLSLAATCFLYAVSFRSDLDSDLDSEVGAIFATLTLAFLTFFFGKSFE